MSAEQSLSRGNTACLRLVAPSELPTLWGMQVEVGYTTPTQLERWQEDRTLLLKIVEMLECQ